MRALTTLSLTLSIAIALVACGKDPEAPQTAEAAAAPAPAEAAPAQAAPAAATEPAAPAVPAAEEDSAIAQKRAAVAHALAEQKIVEDPLGQWAASATASSTYNEAKEQASYSAWQATGAPNVERYGDNGSAWAAAAADAGVEWISLEFAKPVHALGLRVRQNDSPGAIIKLELIDDAGASHTLWEGLDEASYPASQIAWFERRAERTAYLVKGAKITLATNAVSGWNEIDAVQLLGEAPAAP
jgi:hypothetical protein